MSQEPNASTFTPVAGTAKEKTILVLTVKEWAEEFKPLANPVNPNADIRGYAEGRDPETGILFGAKDPKSARIIKEIFTNSIGGPLRLWTFFEVLAEDDSGDETVEEYAVAGYRQEGEIDGKLLGWFVTQKPYDSDCDYLIRGGEGE